MSDGETVLHVIYSLRNGGTERFLVNLLSMTNLRYRNVVVYYDGDNYFEELLARMGIDTIKVSGRNYCRMKRIREIIKQRKVSIVYSYTYYNSVYVMVASLLSGVKKRIVHSHRSEANRHINRFRVFLARFLITILSTDRLACNRLAGESLFMFHRYRILLNGINLERFVFDLNKRNLVRKQLGIKDSYLLLGTVGRLDKNKNQIFMIKILKQLIKQGRKCKLVIFGEGEEKSILEEYISQNNLDGYVIFMGVLDDIYDFYNAMDIFLLTSFNEGLPFVLIEAQANGLPVVASSSIAKEAKINENFRFLNLEDGPKKWAETISSEQFERVKPKHKINDYSLQKTVKIVEEIYEKN